MKSCLITRLSRRRLGLWSSPLSALPDRLRADMGLPDRPAQLPARPFFFLTPLMKL
ncbi:hypothetical protein [Nioella sp. MMSF_3534]|jgi:hypothetical protein|uniref:hypothetical protein n=1 Tax=Nioella sp. MMSF_3534 TaxID=3046720 RepID=UPI00273F6F7A|nr:hypothetical protein [Nioella sp. MMSF_3534]